MPDGCCPVLLCKDAGRCEVQITSEEGAHEFHWAKLEIKKYIKSNISKVHSAVLSNEGFLNPAPYIRGQCYFECIQPFKAPVFSSVK